MRVSDCTIVFAIVFSVFAGSLFATPEYGADAGKSCRFCHFSPAGGGELNGQGRNYLGKRLKSLPSGGVAPPDKSSMSKTASSFKERKEAKIAAKETERVKRITDIERTAMVSRVLRARKTYRNAILKGRKLFHEPGILGAGVQSCKDCHKAASLSLEVKSYPKWDEDLSEVITFDRKLRHCIYKKMKGKPLSPETPVTVALTVYLNEVKKGSVK